MARKPSPREVRPLPAPATPSVPATGAAGKLFLVSTPIGNLEDVTLRAIRILKEAGVIACEDTRRTQILLEHYSIETRTTSYHEHNEITRAPELVLEMEQGSSVALVSDAGMPGISDPGYRLVHLAIRRGITVVPIPGASAFVAALAASGLPAQEFRFLGFLPSRKLARKKALEGLKDAGGVLVFYEAPHRVVEMLEDARQILGERPMVVAREVTKIHEEFLRGNVSKVLDSLKQKPVKGEITVLMGPAAGPQRDSTSHAALRAELEQVMAERGLDERAALKAVARARGISKSEAYRQWQMEKSRKP